MTLGQYNLRKRVSKVSYYPVYQAKKPRKSSSHDQSLDESHAQLPLTPPPSSQPEHESSEPVAFDPLIAKFDLQSDNDAETEIEMSDNQAEPNDEVSSSSSSVEMSDGLSEEEGSDYDYEQVKRKKNPQIYVMYRENAPPGYKRVNVGNAFITRNVRKRCLEEGYDLYELNTRSGYKYYTSLKAIYAPQRIVDEVCRLGQSSAEKRRLTREKADARERQKAWASFDRLFPRMPEEDRESVFARAFEKGSGRIGHKKGLDMDSKINLATRAHVKYQYTDFEALLEEAKSDLYERTIGSVQFGVDKFSKNYAYEEFREGKSALFDELDQDVQDEIDQQIRKWK
jgi:hypothetical protein